MILSMTFFFYKEEGKKTIDILFIEIKMTLTVTPAQGLRPLLDDFFLIRKIQLATF